MTKVSEYLKKKKGLKTPDEIMAKVLNMVETIKGEKGDKGDDGKTPVKFKDYFTQTDINRIVKLVQGLIRMPKDGYTPIKGKDYFDGKEGKSPKESYILDLIKPLIPKVENGKDGSPDKPLDVAKKLNTLEEKVDMKVIKGMKEYLKKLEETIFYKKGGSGGGMGNLVPETFSVSSTTTSITLSYEVASNGTAIWLYYEGQHLAQNVHYTVSGKVVTLLATLSDDTNVDVKYHRK